MKYFHGRSNIFSLGVTWWTVGGGDEVGEDDNHPGPGHHHPQVSQSQSQCDYITSHHLTGLPLAVRSQSAGAW